jgi:hypothetical protein
MGGEHSINYRKEIQAFYGSFSNASLCRANLPRSGRDAGENLIAVTSACPSTKRMTQPRNGRAIDGECYPALKNLNHPLYKILGDIPAGSSLPAVGRGFRPRFSGALLHSN